MNKKFWLALFIISVVGIGVVVAYMVGLKPAGINADINSTPATLAFSPSSTQIPLNQTSTIDIKLDTKGAVVDGVDLYINYDPAYLAVQDSDAATSGVQIKKGALFPTYLDNNVNATDGKITLSGIITPGTAGYSGSGTFASIVVKGIKETTGTRLTFDYVRGDTTDTNVIEHGTSADLLASVTNGAFSVGESPAPSPSNPNNGTNPKNATGNNSAVNSATTGTTISIILIVLLVILAGASLVYLLKKDANQPQGT